MTSPARRQRGLQPSVVGKETATILSSIVQGQDGRRMSFIATGSKSGMKSLEALDEVDVAAPDAVELG
jgi:hypothetical protein